MAKLILGLNTILCPVNIGYLIMDLVKPQEVWICGHTFLIPVLNTKWKWSSCTGLSFLGISITENLSWTSHIYINMPCPVLSVL